MYQLPRLLRGLHPVGIGGLLKWSCYRLAAADVDIVTIDYTTGWMISNNSCRVLAQYESSGRLEHLLSIAGKSSLYKKIIIVIPLS